MITDAERWAEFWAERLGVHGGWLKPDPTMNKPGGEPIPFPGFYFLRDQTGQKLIQGIGVPRVGS